MVIVLSMGICSRAPTRLFWLTCAAVFMNLRLVVENFMKVSPISLSMSPLVLF